MRSLNCVICLLFNEMIVQKWLYFKFSVFLKRRSALLSMISFFCIDYKIRFRCFKIFMAVLISLSHCYCLLSIGSVQRQIIMIKSNIIGSSTYGLQIIILLQMIGILIGLIKSIAAWIGIVLVIRDATVSLVRLVAVSYADIVIFAWY